MSLVIGVGAALLAVTLGAGVGLTAGLAGRRTDQLLMRSVDVALALPRIIINNKCRRLISILNFLFIFRQK